MLLVNPSQQYPADKSNDASSSLRSTELNGFAYRALDGQSANSSDTSSERQAHLAVASFWVTNGTPCSSCTITTAASVKHAATNSVM